MSSRALSPGKIESPTRHKRLATHEGDDGVPSTRFAIVTLLTLAAGWLGFAFILTAILSPSWLVLSGPNDSVSLGLLFYRSKGLTVAVDSNPKDEGPRGIVLRLAPAERQNPTHQWSLAGIGRIMNNWQHQCLALDTDAPPGKKEVWVGPLSGGSKAVLFFNRGDHPVDMSAPASLLQLQPTTAYSAKEVWTKEVTPIPAGEGFKLEKKAVPRHGVAYWRVDPANAL